MPVTKLIPVSYHDTANAINLKCYADTLVYEKTAENDGKLLGIRFGGYPEQARGLMDAIYGGGTLYAERQNMAPLQLKSLAKQYTRQQSMDGVYCEAMLLAQDDSDMPIRTQDAEQEGQTKLEIPPRNCYIFTPPGDKDRLFEEIDKRVRVPLIPEFQEYLLEELTQTKTLEQLTVVANVSGCYDALVYAKVLNDSLDTLDAVAAVGDQLHVTFRLGGIALELNSEHVK